MRSVCFNPIFLRFFDFSRCINTILSRNTDTHEFLFSPIFGSSIALGSFGCTMHNIPEIRDNSEFFGVVPEMVSHVLSLHSRETRHHPAEIDIKVKCEMNTVINERSEHPTSDEKEDLWCRKDQVHGKLHGEDLLGIGIELNGDSVPLVHEDVMVYVLGEYLLKEIGNRLCFWVQLVFSVEHESMVVVLRVGPDDHEAAPEVYRERLEELVEAFTKMKSNRKVHQNERQNNFAIARVVFLPLVIVVFFLVGVQDDAVSAIDVPWPPHERQKFLVGHLPYLGNESLFDINHSIQSVVYFFFLFRYFGPLIFQKLILLNVSDFEPLAHLNGGPRVTLVVEYLGDVVADVFRDQLLRSRVLKLLNVEHIVPINDVFFVFSLTSRLNVFNAFKFHSQYLIREVHTQCPFNL